MFVDKSDLSPYYHLISLISAFNMTFYCLLKINFLMQTDQIFADFPEVMEKNPLKTDMTAVRQFPKILRRLQE